MKPHVNISNKKAGFTCIMGQIERQTGVSAIISRSPEIAEYFTMIAGSIVLQDVSGKPFQTQNRQKNRLPGDHPEKCFKIAGRLSKRKNIIFSCLPGNPAIFSINKLYVKKEVKNRYIYMPTRVLKKSPDCRVNRLRVLKPACFPAPVEVSKCHRQRAGSAARPVRQQQQAGGGGLKSLGLVRPDRSVSLTRVKEVKRFLPQLKRDQRTFKDYETGKTGEPFLIGMKGKGRKKFNGMKQ